MRAKLGAAPVHPMQWTMLNVQTRESQRKYKSKQYLKNKMEGIEQVKKFKELLETSYHSQLLKKRLIFILTVKNLKRFLLTCCPMPLNLLPLATIIC